MTQHMIIICHTGGGSKSLRLFPRIACRQPCSAVSGFGGFDNNLNTYCAGKGSRKLVRV